MAVVRHVPEDIALLSDERLVRLESPSCFRRKETGRPLVRAQHKAGPPVLVQLPPTWGRE
jgi:hypothetical protein